MKHKFVGTFEELKKLLAPLEGDWVEIGLNQKQLKRKDGGILNWYASNGTIYIQGAKETQTPLESSLTRLLEGSADAREHEKQIPATPTAAPNTTASQTPAEQVSPGFLRVGFTESEVILALVGAVGTELGMVVDVLRDRLKVVGYEVQEIRVSTEIIPTLISQARISGNEFGRISGMMTAGDEARNLSGDNSILALGAAGLIASERTQGTDGSPDYMPRRAYIINSLKHPDEVVRLRQIYPQGFYLIGVHADNERRLKYLKDDKRMSEEEAKTLIKRDSDEQIPHGQRVTDTFHMSDFFVRLEGDAANSIRNAVASAK